MYYTKEQIEEAAIRRGRVVSSRVIIKELEALHKDAPDNGTLTWEELTAYYNRNNPTRPSTLAVIQIRNYVLAHREPEYPVNTVVRDAKGNWYRRFTGGWGSFGNTTLIGFDKPARPLEVMK